MTVDCAELLVHIDSRGLSTFVWFVNISNESSIEPAAV